MATSGIRRIALPTGGIGIRWLVLSIIILASFVSYMLRINVSIVGETMIHDLGMNEYQLGFVFSAFAAGYALFQFPGGIYGNKVGPRFAIASIAIAWGLLTVVTALIPGADVMSVGAIVAALVVTRFLVGATHGPFFPVTFGGTIASWFPLSNWGIANGTVVAGMTLGAAVAGPLIVWLMESFGWRGALLATAPTGLLIGVLYYWYVSDDPADHPAISERELAIIAGGRPPAVEVAEKGAWLAALANRNILLLAGSYFCMNYVFYLFFSWFFYYLVDVRGFAASVAAIFTAAQWILGAIGGVAGGLTCDFLVRKYGIRRGTRALAATALLLSGVFLYVGAMAESIEVAVVCLCISFGCTQITDSPFWVATMSISGKHAQVGTGILNTGGNIPGVVGGLMVPVIAGFFGWPAAIASGSLFAVVGAGLWLLVRADEPLRSVARRGGAGLAK